MFAERKRSPKEASDNRILKVKPISGKKVLSSTGLVDPRCFSGENSIHAIRDPKDSLWYIRYAQGSTPQVLRQKFTGFNPLMRFTKDYLSRRGVEVVEVVDYYADE